MTFMIPSSKEIADALIFDENRSTIFNETYASLILNTGIESSWAVVSLLSIKHNSSNIIEAFGKYLNGVKERSEKEILPLILWFTDNKTVLLISFL